MGSSMHRVVAIGDLNGACGVLRDILRGTRLIDRSDKWIGRNTHLVQVGDVFNRGGSARQAFELLWTLRAEAPSRRSRVTVLLGNHEVMTAQGNEAYCTAAEYLSFATPAQRRAWPMRRYRALRRIYGDYPSGGPIAPLEPRVAAWEIENVPGRAAMRRALGPRGAMGKRIRRLPIAVVAGGCVFSHAPLTPIWARLGVSGLNDAALAEWREAPRFYSDMDRSGILSARNGPLWNRDLMLRETARTRRQLARALELMGATRMVTGHTQTRYIKGGKAGRIAKCHRSKLIGIDVGIGRGEPSPRTALIITAAGGVEWTPNGTRRLW